MLLIAAAGMGDGMGALVALPVAAAQPTGCRRVAKQPA